MEHQFFLALVVLTPSLDQHLVLNAIADMCRLLMQQLVPLLYLVTSGRITLYVLVIQVPIQVVELLFVSLALLVTIRVQVQLPFVLCVRLVTNVQQIMAMVVELHQLFNAWVALYQVAIR